MFKLGIDIVHRSWTPICYEVRDHESSEIKYIMVSNYLCYKANEFKWNLYNARPEVNEGVIYYMEEEPNFYA